RAMVSIPFRGSARRTGIYYVTASKSARGKRFGRQTERFETLRASGTTQKARPMEGGRSRGRFAQDQGRGLIRRADANPPPVLTRSSLARLPRSKSQDSARAPRSFCGFFSRQFHLS